MRDIPDFTCEYGVASLVLREIPRSGAAYCMVVQAVPGCEKQLLNECRSFCRMAGAERVYALNQETEPSFTLIRMAALRAVLGSTDACLWPMLPENREE